jgi:hypothetical protein
MVASVICVAVTISRSAKQKGAAKWSKRYFYTKHTEVYINSKNDETKSPATMKKKLF